MSRSFTSGFDKDDAEYLAAGAIRLESGEVLGTDLRNARIGDEFVGRLIIQIVAEDDGGLDLQVLTSGNEIAAGLLQAALDRWAAGL